MDQLSKIISSLDKNELTKLVGAITDKRLKELIQKKINSF